MTRSQILTSLTENWVLKTLWEMEKMQVASIFSFFLNRLLWKNFGQPVEVEKIKLEESMDRCTGLCFITEIMLKMVLLYTSYAVSHSYPSRAFCLAGMAQWLVCQTPWLGGTEFVPRLRRTFFPAYFHLSPLQKHVRKVESGFGRKSCVSTGVRKPGDALEVIVVGCLYWGFN